MSIRNPYIDPLIEDYDSADTILFSLLKVLVDKVDIHQLDLLLTLLSNDEIYDHFSEANFVQVLELTKKYSYLRSRMNFYSKLSNVFLKNLEYLSSKKYTDNILDRINKIKSLS